MELRCQPWSPPRGLRESSERLIVLYFRFLAVVFPVSSLSLRTVSNASVACVSIWILIPAAGFPLWFAHNDFNDKKLGLAATRFEIEKRYIKSIKSVLSLY